MSFLVLLKKKKKNSDKSGKWALGVVVMPEGSHGVGDWDCPGLVAVVSPSPPRLVWSPEEELSHSRMGESSTVSVQLKRKYSS